MPCGTFIGTLNEDFAVEANVGCQIGEVVDASAELLAQREDEFGALSHGPGPPIGQGGIRRSGRRFEVGSG